MGGLTGVTGVTRGDGKEGKEERVKRGEEGKEKILACGRADRPMVVQEVLADLKTLPITMALTLITQ